MNRVGLVVYIWFLVQTAAYDCGGSSVCKCNLSNLNLGASGLRNALRALTNLDGCTSFELDLSNNNLLFSHLEKLEAWIDDTKTGKSVGKINLSNNNLNQLNGDVFDKANVLTEVDLTSNVLTSIPSSMSWPSTLNTLKLDNNRLSSLPPSLFELDFSKGQFSATSNTFTALPQNLFDPLVPLDSLDRIVLDSPPAVPVRSENPYECRLGCNNVANETWCNQVCNCVRQCNTAADLISQCEVKHVDSKYFVSFAGITLSPTSAPTTRRPTNSPTSPTFSPSISPTLSPTSLPTTLSPTSLPTLSPTSLTSSPTSLPTKSSPTLRPSFSPTAVPSLGGCIQEQYKCSGGQSCCGNLICSGLRCRQNETLSVAISARTWDGVPVAFDNSGASVVVQTGQKLKLFANASGLLAATSFTWWVNSAASSFKWQLVASSAYLEVQTMAAGDVQYRVTCLDLEDGVRQASAVLSLRVVDYPAVNGSCVVWPAGGKALMTSFDVRCSGWTTQAPSPLLQYTVVTSSSDGSSDVVTLAELTSLNRDVTLSVGVLEAGNRTLQVVVTTQLHARTTVLLVIEVFAASELDPHSCTNGASTAECCSFLSSQLDFVFAAVNSSAAQKARVAVAVLSSTDVPAQCANKLWERVLRLLVPANATINATYELSMPPLFAAQTAFLLATRAPAGFFSAAPANVDALLAVANASIPVLSHQVCHFLIPTIWALLQPKADVPCPQLELSFGSYGFLGCLCARDKFPGDTDVQESDSGSMSGSFFKCLVDPVVGCEPSNSGPKLQFDADVLADLSQMMAATGATDSSATISVTDLPALIKCRKAARPTAAQSIGSSITSITLYSKDTCQEIPVSNTSEIRFEVNSTAVSGSCNEGGGVAPVAQVCQFWDVSTASWSAAGCRTVAVKSAGDGFDTVTCACTHLTDFAVFVRMRFCQDSHHHWELLFAGIFFFVIFFVALHDGARLKLKIRASRALKREESVPVIMKQISLLGLAALVRGVGCFVSYSLQERSRQGKDSFVYSTAVFFAFNSCIGQLTLNVMFTSIVLTWAQLHLFPLEMHASKLLRFIMFFSNGLVVFLFLLSFIFLIAADNFEDALKSASVFSFLVAFLNSVLGLSSAFYGYHIGKKLNRAKQISNKTSAQAIRTWVLAFGISGLFIGQSFLWSFAGGGGNEASFDIATVFYHVLTLLCLGLVLALYHPKAMKLLKKHRTKTTNNSKPTSWIALTRLTSKNSQRASGKE